MSQNDNFDKYDEYICKTILSVLASVHTYYKYRTGDLLAKKQVGILSEEEYIKQLNDGKYFEDTKKYYNSLCSDKLQILGFTSNNDSFEKIYMFNNEVLNEMLQLKYKEIKPYIIDKLILEDRYNEIKEKLIALDEQIELVALKSGLYFEIFEKRQLPETIINSEDKVKINGEILDLYEANNLADERKIDNLFGDKMGYLIDDYKIDKDEELEEETI